MPCCPHRPENFDPDREGPSDADLARFACDTAACPKCGEEIYDEAQWCPACGAVVSGEVGAVATKTWIIIAAALALAAFAFVFVF